MKGLYSKAEAGEIKDFTGVTALFEAPAKPNLEIKTNLQNEDESILAFANFASRHIKVQ